MRNQELRQQEQLSQMMKVHKEVSHPHNVQDQLADKHVF